MQYGFLVGCDEYTNYHNTDFCFADIMTMDLVLRNFYNYPSKRMETHMLYPYDDTMSSFVVYETLGKWAQESQRGDSLIFYFAGHGMEESNHSYLLLPDTKPTLLSDTALDVTRIIQITANGKWNVFLFLDACYSGITPSHFCISDVVCPQEQTIVVFSACMSTEQSYVDSQKERGLFSFFLTEEMRCADISQPIMMENLKLRVCARMKEWCIASKIQQTPVLCGRMAGNVPFAIRNEKPYMSNYIEKISGGICHDAGEHGFDVERSFYGRGSSSLANEQGNRTP